MSSSKLHENTQIIKNPDAVREVVRDNKIDFRTLFPIGFQAEWLFGETHPSGCLFVIPQPSKLEVKMLSDGLFDLPYGLKVRLYNKSVSCLDMDRSAAIGHDNHPDYCNLLSSLIAYFAEFHDRISFQYLPNL